MSSNNQAQEQPIPIVEIIEDLCCGCETCLLACAYDAIKFDEQKKRAYLVAHLCMGCGTCVAACPPGAIVQPGYDTKDILKVISG